MTGIRFAFTLVVVIAALLGVPVDAQKVVRVGGEVRAPTRVKNVNPVYPEEAKAAGVSGVVIVEIRIGTRGSVAEARVVRSVPLLDQAALDAIYQWEYEPTMLNGEPVDVLMTVTVNFTLD
jgi:protein TonB